MRQTNDVEMLSALRQSLNDLEKVKLISHDDREIAALKASLRQRIAKMEQANTKGN